MDTAVTPGRRTAILQTIPGAEPFLFPGREAPGRTGVLLIHGFTSSPQDMRLMGESLNRQGYTVLGIRLPGHATRPEDLIRTRWQDWLLSVEDGCNLLRLCTDEIFLAGLSLGGMLGLTFASRFPAAGVIAMAAPYERPADPRLRLVRLLSRLSPIWPYIPKRKGGPGFGWFGDGWKEHVAYPQYPTRSVGELAELLDRMHPALLQVKVPALLICSRDDHPLICASLDKIYAALGSPDKDRLWVRGSGHMLPVEPQRHVVFQAVCTFIERASRISNQLAS